MIKGGSGDSDTNPPQFNFPFLTQVYLTEM